MGKKKKKKGKKGKPAPRRPASKKRAPASKKKAKRPTQQDRKGTAAMTQWQKVNGRYVEVDVETTPGLDDWSDDPATVNAAIMKEQESKSGVLDLRTREVTPSKQQSFDTRGGHGYHAWSKCEHDGEEVFQIEQTVFGGGRQTKLDAYDMDLVLDASGMKWQEDKTPAFVLGGTKEWQAINAFVAAPAEHVRLNWPDGKAPPVMYEAWPVMLDLCLKHEYVVACCIGGHGRTGTILSCLLVVAGHTAEDAIQTVRSRYCKSAVETQTQIDYIVGLEAWARANNKDRTYAVAILGSEADVPAPKAAPMLGGLLGR